MIFGPKLLKGCKFCFGYKNRNGTKFDWLQILFWYKNTIVINFDLVQE
jgi:hypothetical protein